LLHEKTEEINKLVSTVLTQYLPRSVNVVVLPSSEWVWNNGCQREALSTQENHIFSSPGAITTEMRDTVSTTDIRPCTEFQPNPFSSFGGDASQTDRQTHTNGKLNIRPLSWENRTEKENWWA